MLTGVYAAMLVLTTVVFGMWSDRVGRRKVFVVSVLGSVFVTRIRSVT